MKHSKVLITYLLLLLSNVAICQIGALNMNPEQSAELDLTSTNKGLLIPRVALTTDLNNALPVSSPVEGLLIFNIGSNQTQGFYFWTGSYWSLLKSPSGMEITGPLSATDNAAVRFDGTTGKIIQNSQVIIDDLSNITSVNNLTVAGFQLTTSPLDGKILLSNATGVASWQSAPPIDVEQNDLAITTNANTLNFEGGNNVFEDTETQATVRFYYNNVTKDVLQLSSTDSLDLNNLTSTVAIPWDIEQHKDHSSFVHSNTTNPSHIQVLIDGIYEVNFMFSIINTTIMRKTVRARLQKNGIDIIPYVNSYSFSYNMADDVVSHISSSFLIELNSNDYIELITNGQTNSGPVNLIPYENVFFIRLIREL
ncbi:MAG: hypothetical protein QM503_04085 [Bacteroidota bacterium]